MKRFQINSSKLFFTYSEVNDTTKEDVYNFLQERFEPKEILVAHELHKNGHDHYHAYLSFDQPLRTCNSRFADYTRPDGVVFHGNYQGCRSPKNVVIYCTKEDNYLANFDITPLLGKTGSMASILGKRILEGEDLLEICKEFPQHIKGYKRLKEDIQEFKEDQRLRDHPIDLPAEVPNSWNQRFMVDTDNKKCHYWFYSNEPNKGKTTGTILPLIRDHHAALFAPKAQYQELSVDTKVICIDEFSPGQLKAEQLNQMCDGLWKYRVIYRGNIQLNEKPLIVVCSNYSINQVFPIKYDLVKARFNEYDVSQY